MQSDNRFLDDLAKLASGAAGALHGARSEMEQGLRAFMQRQLTSMDLVSRDEFALLRDAHEALKKDHAALKAEMMAFKAAAPKKASAPKGAAAKSVKK